MSIITKELDSYIEKRKNNKNSYNSEVFSKKDKKVKTQKIMDDSDEIFPKEKESFLTKIMSIFKRRDDELFYDDVSDMKSNGNYVKKSNFGEDVVPVAFDNNGNIIGKERVVATKKKKGFFGFFSNRTETDFDAELEESAFLPEESSEDTRKLIKSIENILKRLSPSGLDIIKKSQDYQTIKEIEKKYELIGK